MECTKMNSKLYTYAYNDYKNGIITYYHRTVFFTVQLHYTKFLVRTLRN